MKRFFIPLAAVFMVAMSLCTSCLGDEEDDVVFPHTAAVTSATLGTLKRTVHLQTRDGRDSTYTVNLTGAYYPLHIDQLKGRIYNTDSLPVGTDVKHVTFSALTHTGTGITIDAATTESDTIFSASDSTDFSRERVITIYNAYGEKRPYRVELRVHQEEGDSFVWHKRSSGRPELAAARQLKAFVRGDQVALFIDEGGQTALLTAPKEQPWALERQPAGTEAAPAPESIVLQGDTFYGLRDGKLLKSDDGRQWEPVPTSAELKMLAGSGTKHLVGLTADGFSLSSDGGRTWQPDEADEPDMMPESDIACTHIPSHIDPTFEEIVIVGKKGTESVVWRKNIDLTGGRNYEWNYLPAPEAGDTYACPLLDSPSLTAYDGGTLLMGIELGTGTVAAPFMSRENGRSWRTDDIKRLPAGSPVIGLAVATDGTDLYVYAGGTGEVWTGRFNRLGWQWSADDNYVYKAPRR